MAEEKTLHEIFREHGSNIRSMWKQAFSKEQGGITASDFFGAFKTSFINLMTKITNKLKIDPVRGDNVFIPAGQKTLIGDDFANLYAGEVGTKDVETNDGMVTCLDPKTSYATNMHSSVLFSEGKGTYGGLTPTEKAAYECILFTKKCANEYDGTNSEAIMEKYNETMDKYKSYCEDNGIEWLAVQNKMTNDLQAESAEYRKHGDSTNLHLTNLSHNLFLHNAGPDYRDPICNYVGFIGYKYADTLSLDMSDVSSFKAIKANAHDAFFGLTSDVYNVASTTISKGQDLVKDGVDAIAHKSAENEDATKDVPDASTDDAKMTEKRTNEFVSELGTDFSEYSDSNSAEFDPTDSV